MRERAVFVCVCVCPMRWELLIYGLEWTQKELKNVRLIEHTLRKMLTLPLPLGIEERERERDREFGVRVNMCQYHFVISRHSRTECEWHVGRTFYASMISRISASVFHKIPSPPSQSSDLDRIHIFHQLRWAFPNYIVNGRMGLLVFFGILTSFFFQNKNALTALTLDVKL